MNKLQNLIKEKCPNGVHYVEIRSIAEVGTGNCDRKDAVENGKYPFYVRSKEVFKINKYEYDETAIVIPGEGGIGEIFHFVQGKYALHQRAYRIHLLDDKIDAKFLYYYMFANFKSFIMKKAVSATVTSIRKPMIEEFEIPVPPIEVQQEIVRILDKFTDLEAGLQAELEARKKQFEYYKEKLISNAKDAEIKTIKEIATDIYRGAGIKRNEITQTGIPCLRYGEIYTSYNITFNKCISFTKEDIVVSPKYFEYGDILFAITGESVEDIAKCIAYLGCEKCMCGGDIVVMKHNQEPRYISYALSTYNAVVQKGKGKVKSKVVHSSVPAIQKIQIPVPPIEEQSRIANKLDAFLTLIYDKEKGLPAEIEARHKQYEYYRDKLLTFKRKEV